MQQLEKVSCTSAELRLVLAISFSLGAQNLGLCVQVAQLQSALPSSLQHPHSSQTSISGQELSKCNAADVLLEARTHAAALMQVAAKLQQTLKCDQQQLS